MSTLQLSNISTPFHHGMSLKPPTTTSHSFIPAPISYNFKYDQHFTALENRPQYVTDKVGFVHKKITVLTSEGYYNDAVTLYIDLLSEGLICDGFYAFPVLMKAVGGLCDFGLTRQFHGHLLKLGALHDVYVANSVLGCLWKYGFVEDVVEFFETMEERDTVSWSTMISGFCRCGMLVRSLELFACMTREYGMCPNRVACLSGLSCCASMECVVRGKQIHGYVVKSGLDADDFVLNGLLDMYVKCGRVERAELLFESLLENARQNTVLWNVMLLGYVENGSFLKALSHFFRMMLSGVKPDSSTMVALLVFCSQTLNLAFGEQIHALIIKMGVGTDVKVGTSLIDMYFKCANPESGLKVFDRFHDRNLVTWGTIVTNCSRSGYSRKALNLFVAGLEHGFLDLIILLAALRACSSLALTTEGMVIHGMAIKLGVDIDIYIVGAVTDLYAKCQDMVSAQKAFARMHLKDEVSWSTLMSGYVHNGLWDDALIVFNRMQQLKIRPNAMIISSAVSMCSRVYGNLQCKELHGYSIRHGFETNTLINNSLIVAYARCGNIESSTRVFWQMEVKDDVSWNSIILGLGLHGHVDEMLALFEKMKETDFKPDHHTITAVLSACSHTGRTDEGLKYFRSMKEDHILEPKLEQYTCLVDLLGRAGYLDQAYDVIMAMPYEPDNRIWGALLGSCRIYGNERLAELVAGKIFELDPTSTGYYVLAANLYEDRSSSNEANIVRSKMMDMGLKKSPGCSWIDVDNQIHVFTASDKSHHQVANIYAILRCLTKEMIRIGYTPLG